MSNKTLSGKENDKTLVTRKDNDATGLWKTVDYDGVAFKTLNIVGGW